jgi:hypothetical protein
MITKLTSAVLELENLGHTVNIRGFIWIQGESDANNTCLMLIKLIYLV